MDINMKDVNIHESVSKTSRPPLKAKRKFRQYMLGMCLLSKTEQINKNRNANNEAESNKTDLRKKKLVNQKIKLNNKIAKKIISTEFSFEDDIPLKYLARSLKSSKIAAARKAIINHRSKSTSEADMRLHYSDSECEETSHVDVPENASTVILDKGTDKITIQSSDYYDTEEIVQWIDNCIPNECPTTEMVVDDDTVIKRVPEPAGPRVERRVAPDQVQTSDTRSETSCPSGCHTTVNEVVLVHASRQKTRELCKECKDCNRVNKVRKLTDMLNNTTELERSRVEVNQNNDAAGGVSEHRSNSARPKDKVNSAEDSEPIYLDLLPPDSTQIVQVTTEKVPNQETRVMKARLVCKSKERHSNISLIEYEKILDKLLLNLNLPITKENNATSEVTTPGNIPNPVRTLYNAREKDDATDVIQPSSQPEKNRRNPEYNNNKRVTSTLKNPPPPKIVDAPIFYPTAQEFTDPLSYIKQIMPAAAKFGLCKVVAPEGFNPECTLSDEIRFTVTDQYIDRLYSRWGPAAQGMCAIRVYLAMQKVISTTPPLVEGMAINLPQLYQIVQENGGLFSVIEKQRWTRVVEQMRLTNACDNLEQMLNQVYVKYLLPYDTLSLHELQQLKFRVEEGWNKKHQKTIDRAQNPLLKKQKRLLGETDSSEDGTEDESEVGGALSEAEGCVAPGRRMDLGTFKQVAANVMHAHFPSPITPPTSQVEEKYWRLLLVGTDHVCVSTASIDTGEEGYGFTKNKNDAYGEHPWNLKMLSQNGSNILRSLGPVPGVTVPTLRLGMVFSTSCWHRDPHGLPWVEYMHTGPGKIWYGIPNEQNDNFRRAVETLCPPCCQNKSIWLRPDTAMIPPSLLMEYNVSPSRVEQRPREFIVVFPKAYSCSISTGYSVSESAYFAPSSWLTTVRHVFQVVRDSCEPTLFPLERLLLAAARDPRVPRSVLQLVNSVLVPVVRDELCSRRALRTMGVRSEPAAEQRPAGSRDGRGRGRDQCEFCRTTLYLSKVTGIPGDKSSMCLQHALWVLQAPRHRDCDRSRLELVTFHTQDELQEIIDGVQKRLISSS